MEKEMNEIKTKYKASPGPGHYYPIFSMTSNFSKRIPKITESYSKSSALKQTPGPGAYQIDSSLGKTCPKYGFGVPKEIEIEKKEPLPLTLADPYDKKEKKNIPGVKIVKPKTPPKKEIKMPGPGAYEVLAPLTEIEKKQRYRIYRGSIRKGKEN
jgi:hypothetical protein